MTPKYFTEELDASAPEALDGSELPMDRIRSQAKGRSFDKLWGLHPGVALLALVVNTMLFGGELVTAGAIFPLTLVVGIVLGLVTYRAQVRWHGLAPRIRIP